MNDRQAPDIELDDDAAALLAAFRGEEEIPGELHDRVWARVEADTAADDRKVVAGPWVRRVTIGMVAAAAALALAWISADALDAASTDQVATQAPHSAVVERTSGEASEGQASTRKHDGAAVFKRSIEPELEPEPEPEPGPEPQIEPEPQPPTPVPTPEPAVDNTGKPAKPRKPTAPKKKVEAPDPVEPSTLGEEVALIQKARKALLAKTPGVALTVLRDHADRFPNGAMVQERRALLAIATCEANGADAGRTRAESFLQRHPKAALADRVRTACGLQ